MSAGQLLGLPHAPEALSPLQRQARTRAIEAVHDQQPVITAVSSANHKGKDVPRVGKAPADDKGEQVNGPPARAGRERIALFAKELKTSY